MDRSSLPEDKRLMVIERGVNQTSHEFIQPGEDRTGRITDTYQVERSSCGFSPAEYDGVALRIHLNNDRIVVKQRASVVVKVCFANILSDLAEDGVSQLVEVYAAWQNPSASFPMLPVKLKNLGGYNDQGSQFSLIYKILDSSESFSFSGVTVWFLQQKPNAAFAIFRPIEASLEIITQTNESLDPGRISNISSGRQWKSREEIVEAIAQTEQENIHGLTTLVQNFKIPLSKATIGPQKPLLASEDLGKIFTNIEMLANIHQEFYEEMKKAIAQDTAEQTTGVKLCLAFQKLIPLLKPPYAHYCNGYPASVALVDDLRNYNAKFVEFIMEAKSISQNATLTALLQLPIQHIPRLKMFLGELLENTPSEHPSYQQNKAVVASLEDIAIFLNDCIARDFKMKKILEIQQRLQGLEEDLISPSRSYVFEGLLLKISGSNVDRRWFFLFTDCIIYAKALKGGAFEFRGKWDLSVSFCRDIADSPRLRNAFYVVTPKKTYLLISRTAKSKKIWLDMIHAQIRALKIIGLAKIDGQGMTFKEPKKGLLARFKKDMNAEDIEEVFEQGGSTPPRKDSYMSGFQKVVSNIDNSDVPLPEPTDKIPALPLSPSKSDTLKLTKAPAELERFPSIKKLLGSKAAPEFRKSINNFQSKRMSTMDFLLENLSSNEVIDPSESQALLDEDTIANEEVSDDSEEEENTQEAFAERGRSFTGGKLRTSFVTFLTQTEVPLVPSPVIQAENTGTIKKTTPVPAPAAPAAPSGEPADDELPEGVRDAYVQYMEDLIINNENGSNDPFLCRELFDIKLEDGSVRSVAVLYSTVAQDVIDNLVKELSTEGGPFLPNQFYLTERNEENQLERLISPEEYVLAIVLSWEVPEKMSFVLKKVTPKIEERRKSQSVRVRQTRHIRQREELLKKKEGGSTF